MFQLPPTTSPPDPEPVARSAGPAAPPVQPAPNQPAPLPATGGPEPWRGLLGVGLLAGAAMLLRRRRG
ncbi:LPXTG cell wall anchor domain-containing protein [Naumannella sp. ID2617S]|nr:LPXTG cell wall anchor domain-containing protein [Naumannella sp. ID2617S]